MRLTLALLLLASPLAAQNITNRFANNAYALAGCSASPFAWMNGYRTVAQWAAYGLK